MTDIPEQALEPVEDLKGLPQAVTELPQGIESPEASPYLISFAKYNEKMCEITELNGNKPKKAVEILKTIGTKIYQSADFQKHHIDRTPIRCEGEYKKLFSGIRDDIELTEIKLQQDARIFCFDIEPERTFYVVAITQNHLETDKVRK